MKSRNRRIHSYFYDSTCSSFALYPLHEVDILVRQGWVNRANQNQEIQNGAKQ
jgi:hypothetical protein